MKRSTFITLLCSLTAAVVMILGVMLGLVATGVLDIGQNTLIITSGSAKSIYDGTALVDTEWHLSKGELKEGHRLSVNVTGSQTNVGQSENYMDATVIDENGADVTSEYKITYKYGVLEVTARDICVIADSAKKRYDGEPLTSDSYTLMSKRQLIATDTIEVKIEGQQTEIGSSDNEIVDVKITNQQGEDVLRNYNVIEQNGILIVYDENGLVIRTDSDTKEYDGSKLTNTNWYLEDGELKEGHRLEVEVTGFCIGANTPTFNEFNAKVVNADGEDVTSSYSIYKECGTLLVEKRMLTVVVDHAATEQSGEIVYTIYPAVFDNLVIIDGIVAVEDEESGETKYALDNNDFYVYDKETGKRDLTNNFNVEIADPDSFESESGSGLTELVFESASASKTFDGTPLKGEMCNLISGNLKSGHKPIVTYTGSRVAAGFADNTFDVRIVDTNRVYEPINNETGEVDADAIEGKKKDNVTREVDGEYVQVYENTTDETVYVDVTDQYNIKKKEGTLRVFPVEVVVRSNGAQKVYDGEPLKNSYSVVTSSARFNLIVDKNTDLDGIFAHDVDISKYQLDIFKPDEDPTTENTGEDFEGAEGAFGVVRIGTITEIGKGYNTITAVLPYIWGVNKETGVSEQVFLSPQNFSVKTEYGTLFIVETEDQLKKELTFVSDDLEKDYDGTPLIPHGGRLDPDFELPAGYTFVPVDGEDFAITDPGKSDNVFTVQIFNGEGIDATEEFILNYEYGVLVVNKRDLKIHTGEKTDIYKAKDSLICHDTPQMLGRLFAGDMIYHTFTGVQTHYGESKNTLLYSIDTKIAVTDRAIVIPDMGIESINEDIVRNYLPIDKNIANYLDIYDITVEEGMLVVIDKRLPDFVIGKLGTKINDYIGDEYTEREISKNAVLFNNIRKIEEHYDASGIWVTDRDPMKLSSEDFVSEDKDYFKNYFDIKYLGDANGNFVIDQNTIVFNYDGKNGLEERVLTTPGPFDFEVAYFEIIDLETGKVCAVYDIGYDNFYTVEETAEDGTTNSRTVKDHIILVRERTEKELNTPDDFGRTEGLYYIMGQNGGYVLPEHATFVYEPDTVDPQERRLPVGVISISNGLFYRDIVTVEGKFDPEKYTSEEYIPDTENVKVKYEKHGRLLYGSEDKKLTSITTIIDAGEYDLFLELKIMNGGEDISDEYIMPDIEDLKFTVTIEQAQLTISLGSVTVTETDYANGNYSLGGYGHSKLCGGDTLNDASVKSSIRLAYDMIWAAGDSTDIIANTGGIVIVDDHGGKGKDNYNIVIDPGKLTIIPG